MISKWAAAVSLNAGEISLNRLLSAMLTKYQEADIIETQQIVRVTYNQPKRRMRFKQRQAHVTNNNNVIYFD